MWYYSVYARVIVLSRCRTNSLKSLRKQTHNVGAAWAEGKRSTGVDVGCVQKLQHADEIGTVGLEEAHRGH